MKILPLYSRVVKITFFIIAFFPLFIESIHYFDDRSLLEEERIYQLERARQWAKTYPQLLSKESLFFLPFSALYILSPEGKIDKTLYKAKEFFTISEIDIESYLKEINPSPLDVKIYKDLLFYVYTPENSSSYLFISRAEENIFASLESKVDLYKIRFFISGIWLLIVVILGILVTRPYERVIKLIKKGEDVRDWSEVFSGIMGEKIIKEIEDERERARQLREILSLSWKNVPYGAVILKGRDKLVCNELGEQLFPVMESKIFNLIKNRIFEPREIKKENSFFKLRIVPIYGTEDVFLIQIEDITLEKKEKEQEEMKKRFYFLGESMSSLLHETRNTLSSILGSISLLKGKVSIENERVLTGIREEVQELNFVLKSFTDILKQKRLTYVESFSIKEMLEDVCRDFLDKFDKKKYSLQKNLKPARIDGSKVLLKRSLLNILKNSYEALPEEGGKIIVQNYLTENQIIIQIDDTGTRIPEEEREKILLPFYTTKAKGLGLGLSFVKRVIDLHSGEIHISESESGGTRVEIALPMHYNIKNGRP